MPLSNAQLAALVDRARQKPLPVVSPPPQPARVVQGPVELQRAATRPPQSKRPAEAAAPATPRTLSLVPAKHRDGPRPKPSAAPSPVTAVPLPPPTALPSVLAPQPEHAAEADFPIGWVLDKASWRFNRRFYAVVRRPMRHGEYTHLFKQIRRGEAEHLGEDCWRVTEGLGPTTNSSTADVSAPGVAGPSAAASPAAAAAASSRRWSGRTGAPARCR